MLPLDLEFFKSSAIQAVSCVESRHPGPESSPSSTGVLVADEPEWVEYSYNSWCVPGPHA